MIVDGAVSADVFARSWIATGQLKRARFFIGDAIECQEFIASMCRLYRDTVGERNANEAVTVLKDALKEVNYGIAI